MALRDSLDAKDSGTRVQTRIGRKWSASTSVDQAESMLELRHVVGNTCSGRQGLWLQHFQQWKKHISAREAKGGSGRGQAVRGGKEKDKSC